MTSSSVWYLFLLKSLSLSNLKTSSQRYFKTLCANFSLLSKSSVFTKNTPSLLSSIELISLLLLDMIEFIVLQNFCQVTSVFKIFLSIKFLYSLYFSSLSNSSLFLSKEFLISCIENLR